MKSVLTIILFLTLGLTNSHSKQHQAINLTTFRNVPDDMQGCGDDCYLSANDKKGSVLICRTDYAGSLIYINNKSLLLKANDNVSHDKNEEIYTSGQYILSLKMTYKKQIGDEDYTFKGILTIKSGAKILYQQTVVGDGGC